MKLDLDIGDIILTGRFKNKAVEVKDFGSDDKGQPTINGRPILKFRIKKLMPVKENTKMNKSRIQQIIKEEVSNVLNEQSGIIWKDTKKYKIQKPPRKFAEKSKVGAMIHFTGPKSGAKGETWEKWTPLSWKATFGEGVKGDSLSNSELDKKLESHGRVQIKESIKEAAPKMRKIAAADSVVDTIKIVSRIENGMRAFNSSAHSHVKGDFKKVIKALENLKFKIQRHG